MVTQMKALCKVTDLKQANVVILHVGDLNTTYDSSQLKSLNDNMFYARNTAGGTDKGTNTFNGFGDSNSIIDHIYYGGKAVKPVNRLVPVGVSMILSGWMTRRFPLRNSPGFPIFAL